MTPAPAPSRPTRRRASPRAPQDRRRLLVETTIALVRERHELPSTRDIATAAGIAEGTLFRVYDTKDALVEAVVGAVVCPGPLAAQLAGIEPGLPLRERTLAVTRLLMARFRDLLDLLGPLGVVGPPPHHPHPGCPVEAEAEVDGGHTSGPAYEGSVGLIVRLFADDADELRLPPEEFAHVVRMLAFGGCHRHISRDRPLTPEQVTDLLLDGALRRPDGSPDPAQPGSTESKDASC